MKTKEPAAGSAPISPARLYPGWVGRLVISACLIVIAIVRTLPRFDGMPSPWNDMALANILTLIFGFIATMWLFVWFCFFSGHAPLVRRIALAGAIAFVGLAAALVRLEGVDGNMQPSFAWRMQTATEQAIGKVEAAPAKQADLTSTTAADFPQFLGPERSVFLTGPELARDWAAQPPKLLWKRPIGAGWSGFAAVNGYAVTLEQREADEWVTCYEIATGEPVWGHSIEARHYNPLGGLGPRSTPTIHGGRVFALGATGVLRCLDGSTGKLLWKDDLRARYQLSAAQDEMLVQWGRAASPLIVDDLVVVPAGGPTGRAKSLIAFRAASGEVVWEGGTDQISYASPSLATIAGVRQILSANEAKVTGHNPETGEVLWSHPWPGRSNQDACSSQPVPVDERRVLLTKGYGLGAELIELTAADGKLQPNTVWANRAVLETKFTNVFVRDGSIYGLHNGILECVELESGRKRWLKGRYGHGQILGVSGLILVQAEDGRVALVEANPQRFVELGSLSVFDAKTWNNLCLYGDKLLVRNDREAACFELPIVTAAAVPAASPPE